VIKCIDAQSQHTVYLRPHTQDFPHVNAVLGRLLSQCCAPADHDGDGFNDTDVKPVAEFEIAAFNNEPQVRRFCRFPPNYPLSLLFCMRACIRTRALPFIFLSPTLNYFNLILQKIFNHPTHKKTTGDPAAVAGEHVGDRGDVEAACCCAREAEAHPVWRRRH
jgi:hypothetical protein